MKTKPSRRAGVGCALIAGFTDHQTAGNAVTREFLQNSKSEWTQWASPGAAEKIGAALQAQKFLRQQSRLPLPQKLADHIIVNWLISFPQFKELHGCALFNE